MLAGEDADLGQAAPDAAVASSPPRPGSGPAGSPVGRPSAPCRKQPGLEDAWRRWKRGERTTRALRQVVSWLFVCRESTGGQSPRGRLESRGRTDDVMTGVERGKRLPVGGDGCALALLSASAHRVWS